MTANGTAGRSGAYTLGTLSLALMLVLAVALLRAPRTGVPAIAEIAPQAVQQILEPPPEQTSDVGEEGGGPGGGGGEPDPGDKTQQDDEGIDRGRVLRCVGNPPRQTEDPQSPPCVPYWEGDNGGDTAKGIRDGVIHIAAPGGSALLNNAMETYFNRRFQFYDRKIKLVDTSADRKQENFVQSQIDAANNAADQHQVFASTDYWYGGGVIYNRQLARKGVIGVSYQSIFSEPELRDLHPYIWQYPMATDAQLTVMGEWLCARLAGKQASHAGPLLNGRERVFGLVVYEDFGVSTDTAPLENEMARCGASFGDARRTLRSEDGSSDRTAFADTVLRMRDEEVTTVVCVCDSEPMGTLMQYASGGSFVPEWVVPTYTENEHVWIKRTYPAEQAEHLFGLHFMPMHRLVTDDPWAWAATEVDLGTGWDRLGNESSYSRQSFWHPFYRSLLLIASGIQMAGPSLTPQTFAKGLQRARFPNPDHPIKAGRVGFEGGSHSMTKDTAEWWWTADVIGPYGSAGFRGQGAGTTCFVDDGARRTFGSWPGSRDPFFDGPCVSGDQPAGAR